MDEASELLNRLLASMIKAEIVSLFHKNPGLMDTTDGLARRLGRIGTSVETDLEDLVDLGILRKKRIGGSEIISLDRKKDMKIQEILENHFRNIR